MSNLENFVLSPVMCLEQPLSIYHTFLLVLLLRHTYINNQVALGTQLALGPFGLGSEYSHASHKIFAFGLHTILLGLLAFLTHFFRVSTFLTKSTFHFICKQRRQ